MNNLPKTSVSLIMAYEEETNKFYGDRRVTCECCLGVCYECRPGSLELAKKKNEGNSCHDVVGRFCKKPSKTDTQGGSFPSGETPPERKITKDGLVWSVTAADGTKLQLLDAKGNKISDEIKIQLLQSLADLHDMYPDNKTTKIHIKSFADVEKEFGKGKLSKSVGGWADDKNPNTVYFNGNGLYLTAKIKPGWMMPVSKDISRAQYVLYHEFGHQYDFQSFAKQPPMIIDKDGMAKEGKKDKNAPPYEKYWIHENKKVKARLSGYGKTGPNEGYAEAFAEWHGSNGKTKNPAAIAYARAEHWLGVKPSEYSKSFIPEGYSNNSPLLTFAMKEEGSGITIFDDFTSETGATIIGEEVIPKIAQEDQIRIEGIVRQVWKELGLNYNGGDLSLTSMTAIQLSPEELTEFYNKCHGDDGRFCEGDGGGPGIVRDKAPVSGKIAFYRGSVREMEKKELENPKQHWSEPTVTSPGYSVSTNTGKDIEIRDPQGLMNQAENAESKISIVADTIADLYEDYPVEFKDGKRPNLVIDHIPEGLFGTPVANANMENGTITINTDTFEGLSEVRPLYDLTDPKFYMPNHKNVPSLTYGATHEYGHVLDGYRQRQRLTQSNSLDEESHYAVQELIAHPEFKEHLSNYGRKKPEEAYAETFAEWHTSQGRSENIAAKAMAIQEQWTGWEQAVTSPDEGQFSDGGAINWEFAANIKYIPALVTDTNKEPVVAYSREIIPLPSPEQVRKARERAEQVLSMVKRREKVDLTLIEEPEAHYHWDPVTEFYNQCHSPEDGKFCSDQPVAGRALRDSDGKPSKVTKVPSERGPLGGSLVDPHKGTKTFDGIRGYDRSGKPVPGTDAYLEAHNLAPDLFTGRPYVKYEASKTDPAILEAYPKDLYPKGRTLFTRTAEDTDPEPQTGGYIMYKKEAPRSPQGAIAPQIRPNVPVVTNRGDRAKRLSILEESKVRLETLKNIAPEKLIQERRVRVTKAKLDLERTLAAGPGLAEIAKTEAVDRLAKERKNWDAVKAATDDPVKRKEAELAYKSEKREHDKIVGGAVTKEGKVKIGRANQPNFIEAEIENKTLHLKNAERRLADAIEDPKKALAMEIKWQGGPDGTGVKTDSNSGGIIGRNQKAYDNTAAKYLFTKGVTSARIDVNQDPQNIKNLVEGKGRIYFAMEGSIKNDAILSAIRKEDPKASVVNVPSVTLWQQKGLDPEVPNEIGWFTRTYAKGREVILIPDADGYTNPAVMQQAVSLKSALMQEGAKEVYMAFPPLKPNTTKVVDKFNLPSGKSEERKGIDDHLGAGRGTLGQLHYTTYTDRPSYDLSWATVAKGAKGSEKLSAGGIYNAERVLESISDLVGDKGIATIPLKTLYQASGLGEGKRTSARSAMLALQRIGVINVEYVYDPVEMGRGKRVRDIRTSDDRVNELIDMNVIVTPNLYKVYTESSRELSPVISILRPEYVLKASNMERKALVELPNWKPPKGYTGWTSAVTGKGDTTGIAKKQEEELAKFIEKNTVKEAERRSKAKVAETAAERLAGKKAPSGRRLVRSKAGAKRYGVPIGSVIPLQVSDLTSMVLLSSVVSEEELVEFYNKCHGGDGRFCEGDPISGRSGDWLRSIGNPLDRSQDMDVGGDSSYVVHTSRGDDMAVNDPNDSITRHPEESMTILDTVASLHEMYGGDSPSVDFMSIDKRENGDDTLATASPRGLTFNTDALPGLNYLPENDEAMPMSQEVSEAEYTATHEFGHLFKFQSDARNMLDGGDYGHMYDTSELIAHPEFREHLGTYASNDNDDHEAYAETFAEWHTSRGGTKNIAAKAMAILEGWHGWEGAVTAPDELSLNSITAAGGYNSETNDISIIDYVGGKTKVIYGPNYVHPPTPTSEVMERARGRAEEVLSMAKNGVYKVSPRNAVQVAKGGNALSLKVTEFYNECHDEDGRFCETTDGTKGAVSGKFREVGRVRTVGKVAIGSVEADGVKAKAIYEIKTKDGGHIKLYDKAGNAGDYASELLESQVQMANLYPMKPPRSIIVTKPDSLFRDNEVDKGTFAIVHGDKPYTYINSEMLGVDVGRYKDGFQMPSAKDGDTDNMDYLVTHEYGHQLDFARHSKGGYSYKVHPLYHNKDFQRGLSVYGKSDDRGIEAYAETFAEWHHSNGKTKNPAAVAMARYEGWSGANDSSTTVKESLASGALVNLVLQNAVHLAKKGVGEVKEYPNDGEEVINEDLPKLLGKGVKVIDSLNGPRVIGDFEVVEPTEAEITKANKIMSEVLAELEGSVNE